MNAKETGGESAFPTDGDNYGPKWSNAGMTLRQYAAIKLKVPDSGEDWLDAMILTSLRNDFAAKALQGFTSVKGVPYSRGEYEIAAQSCYRMACSMLEAYK